MLLIGCFKVFGRTIYRIALIIWMCIKSFFDFGLLETYFVVYNATGLKNVAADDYVEFFREITMEVFGNDDYFGTDSINGLLRILYQAQFDMKKLYNEQKSPETKMPISNAFNILNGCIALLAPISQIPDTLAKSTGFKKFIQTSEIDKIFVKPELTKYAKYVNRFFLRERSRRLMNEFIMPKFNGNIVPKPLIPVDNSGIFDIEYNTEPALLSVQESIKVAYDLNKFGVSSVIRYFLLDHHGSYMLVIIVLLTYIVSGGYTVGSRIVNKTEEDDGDEVPTMLDRTTALLLTSLIAAVYVALYSILFFALHQGILFYGSRIINRLHKRTKLEHSLVLMIWNQIVEYSHTKKGITIQGFKIQMGKRIFDVFVMSLLITSLSFIIITIYMYLTEEVGDDKKNKSLKNYTGIMKTLAIIIAGFYAFYRIAVPYITDR
jgi:hypothetical protein